MIAFIALLTMATFAGEIMAQTPERPAAPAVTDKPSVSAAEKPKTQESKVEKKETAKAIRVSKTVAALRRRHFLKSNLSIKSPPFPPGGKRCGTSFHMAL
jgi:hypothetical protein